MRVALAVARPGRRHLPLARLVLAVLAVAFAAHNLWRRPGGGPVAARGGGGARTAPLRGRTRKAGPIPLDLFHPNRTRACFRERAKPWMAALGDAATPNRPPCTFWCQVWVNRQYKAIFLRHAKTGSTTVLKSFGECQYEPDKPGCLELATAGDIPASEDGVAAWWADHFVFTVVRDPFDRAVSAYAFLLQAVLASPACSELMDWDRFCVNPMSLARLCASRPACCASVKYEGGNPVQRAVGHLMTQASCMTAAGGRGLAVDFVLRQEHLGEDLASLLQLLNERRAAGLPALAPPREPRTDLMRQRCAQGRSVLHARHRPMNVSLRDESWVGLAAKEDYCETAEYYGTRHPRCRAGVARHFAEDVALLAPA